MFLRVVNSVVKTLDSRVRYRLDSVNIPLGDFNWIFWHKVPLSMSFCIKLILSQYPVDTYAKSIAYRLWGSKFGFLTGRRISISQKTRLMIIVYAPKTSWTLKVRRWLCSIEKSTIITSSKIHGQKSTDKMDGQQGLCPCNTKNKPSWQKLFLNTWLEYL